MSSNVSAMEIEEEAQDFPSPTWSRHISFLPPIADNSSVNLPKVSQPQQTVPETNSMI